MKTNQLVASLAVALSTFAFAGVKAGETASVTQKHVNVRGQPSLIGEVITQLQKGEKVVILEEIPVEKPKKGEPAAWARIQMPANTPVWVFADFIDAGNKSVSVSRVNLRAGPGENFSVVGRLDRGETVKEIRRVENWMEIETPDKAYAFVALNLLAKDAPTPAATKTESVAPPPAPKPEPDRTAPPIAATLSDSAPPPLTLQPVSETPPPAIETPAAAASQPLTTTENTPAVSNVVSTPPAPAPVPVVTTPETAAPPLTDTAPPPKRIVRREGIVRSTKSIQAPTYFELVSTDTRKVVNYLHTLDPELKLKDFKGRKIIVTGEEGVDPRWPRTPILEAETIEVAP
ncbi:MAG: hypothetical protein FJ398_18160 [Verrucomicrobia bacterium]|nr:hypothetical protein [Verrucomicrobiota bacterium]